MIADKRTYVAAMLRKAAQRVVRGWCQGHYAVNRYGNPTSTRGRAATRWCVVGAIEAAAFMEWGRRDAYQALIDHLRKRGKWGKCPDLQDWNDTRGRTASQVVRALRAAADQVEKRGL